MFYIYTFSGTLAVMYWAERWDMLNTGLWSVCVFSWGGACTLNLFWNLRTFLLCIRDDEVLVSPVVIDMQNYFSVPEPRQNEGTDKWHIKEVPKDLQPPPSTLYFI